jgi:hypothetical protein
MAGVFLFMKNFYIYLLRDYVQPLRDFLANAYKVMPAGAFLFFVVYIQIGMLPGQAVG